MATLYLYSIRLVPCSYWRKQFVLKNWHLSLRVLHFCPLIRIPLAPSPTIILVAEILLMATPPAARALAAAVVATLLTMAETLLTMAITKFFLPMVCFLNFPWVHLLTRVL